MTDLPGSSAVFRGGVVSYTNAVKEGVLGVPHALLEEHGAVSGPVARAMAEGARRVLGCDIAVSTTEVCRTRTPTSGAIRWYGLCGHRHGGGDPGAGAPRGQRTGAGAHRRRPQRL